MSLTHKSMRKNAMSSVVSWTDLSGKEQSCHASEWWNGEGVDFTILKDSEDKVVSLHLDELHALVVQAIAFGMLDMNLVQTEAKELEDSIKKDGKLIAMHTTSVDNGF